MLKGLAVRYRHPQYFAISIYKQRLIGGLYTYTRISSSPRVRGKSMSNREEASTLSLTWPHQHLDVRRLDDHGLLLYKTTRVRPAAAQSEIVQHFNAFLANHLPLFGPEAKDVADAYCSRSTIASDQRSVLKLSATSMSAFHQRNMMVCAGLQRDAPCSRRRPISNGRKGVAVTFLPSSRASLDERERIDTGKLATVQLLLVKMSHCVNSSRARR